MSGNPKDSSLVEALKDLLASKDEVIASKNGQIAALKEALKAKGSEIATLRNHPNVEQARYRRHGGIKLLERADEIREPADPPYRYLGVLAIMVKADMPLTKSMIQDAYLGARWSLNKNVDVESQIDYALRQLVKKKLAHFDNSNGWTATDLGKQEITPSDPFYAGLSLPGDWLTSQ